VSTPKLDACRRCGGSVTAPSRLYCGRRCREAAKKAAARGRTRAIGSGSAQAEGQVLTGRRVVITTSGAIATATASGGGSLGEPSPDSSRPEGPGPAQMGRLTTSDQAGHAGPGRDTRAAMPGRPVQTGPHPTDWATATVLAVHDGAGQTDRATPLDHRDHGGPVRVARTATSIRPGHAGLGGMDQADEVGHPDHEGPWPVVWATAAVQVDHDGPGPCGRTTASVQAVEAGQGGRVHVDQATAQARVDHDGPNHEGRAMAPDHADHGGLRPIGRSASPVHPKETRLDQAAQAATSVHAVHRGPDQPRALGTRFTITAVGDRVVVSVDQPAGPDTVMVRRRGDRRRVDRRVARAAAVLAAGKAGSDRKVTRLDDALAAQKSELARLTEENARLRVDRANLDEDVQLLAQVALRTFEALDWRGYGPAVREVVERNLPGGEGLRPWR